PLPLLVKNKSVRRGSGRLCDRSDQQNQFGERCLRVCYPATTTFLLKGATMPDVKVLPAKTSEGKDLVYRLHLSRYENLVTDIREDRKELAVLERYVCAGIAAIYVWLVSQHLSAGSPIRYATILPPILAYFMLVQLVRTRRQAFERSEYMALVE